MDSPAAIWFSYLSLASFEFCCFIDFAVPSQVFLPQASSWWGVVAMALNLWSMGYPGRHDRAWKCTSQNIILKRSEPQQRPSSAFFESFRSLNTKLKSVKHTIYVQLSYYKYCFFKCFFIIFLIVSTTTLWRWLLRKLWSLEAQPVPKCRGLRSGPGNWESFLPLEGAVGLGKWNSNPEASYFGWKNRKKFGWTFWCYTRYFARMVLEIHHLRFFVGRSSHQFWFYKQ